MPTRPATHTHTHSPRPAPQVHDEVILEGPEESAQEALAAVVAAMENPWRLLGESLWGRPLEGNPLRVDLVVDAKTAHTWYEAK